MKTLRNHLGAGACTAALFALAAPGAASAQECQATPFACAVDQAINAGLQYFRNHKPL